MAPNIQISKYMKKSILIAGLTILFFLVSCKQESVKLTSDDPVEQVIQLAEGVEQFGDTWNKEQWEDAVDKLEKAIERISDSDEDYNDNQDFREATSKIIKAEKPYELKFRIMKIFTKKAVEKMGNDSEKYNEEMDEEMDED